MSKILIIPARAGSKRIKNKNIKRIGGIPIIYHSIRTAIKSKIFDEIHVSTESKEIKKIVEKYPLKVKFLREKKLSQDKTPLMEVFNFVFRRYKSMNITFDQIWFLTPCSPLIEKKDLILANKKFKNKKINAILAISEYSPPVQWAFKKMKNFIKPFHPKSLRIRSQDLKKSYYDTGTFGAFKKEVFLKKIKPVFYGFEIERHKGIDIDTPSDWALMEKLFKTK